MIIDGGDGRCLIIDVGEVVLVGLGMVGGDGDGDEIGIATKTIN